MNLGNQLVNFSKRKKNFIGFLVFVLIVVELFTSLTWLFRGNVYLTRQNLTAFRNEPNKIDVVLFAGSDIVEFYDPLQAWAEQGFTSYNYGSITVKTDILRYSVEESRKTNEADVYVFGLESLVFTGEVMEEVPIRNWADSLPIFSPTRWKGINNYLANRKSENEDALSYYLDFIKYHVDTDALSQKTQWDFLDRDNIKSVEKGFSNDVYLTPMEKPIGSDEIRELSEIQENAIQSLLDYCDEEDINALFICSPFIISEENQEWINAAGAMIEARGYAFVDFNKNYDEIGLDFETDYRDVNHVNYGGARKYTSYLAEYLVEHYNLADHRDDEAYASWEENYLETQSKREAKITAHEAKVEWLCSKNAITETLTSLHDADAWLHAVDDDYFTLVMKSDQALVYGDKLEQNTRSFLDKYEIDTDSETYVGVWRASERLSPSTPSGAERAEVYIGVDEGRGRERCVVAVGDESTLTISDVEYDLDSDGIQILAYDNYHKKVVDNVTIHIEDGKMVLTR